jgi:hypothetical protein
MRGSERSALSTVTSTPTSSAPDAPRGWTRGDTLALAHQKCVHCFGVGLYEPQRRNEKPCKCVMRSIFRACYARYVSCSEAPPRMTMIALFRHSKNTGATGKNTSAASGPPVKLRYGYPDAEYCADFVGIAKRTFGRATPRYTLFDLHYLQGEDWKVCTAKLGIDRGSFFHEVYRVEEALGRAYRDTQPFPLWPLDEYFGGRSSRSSRVVSPTETSAEAIAEA